MSQNYNISSPILFKSRISGKTHHFNHLLEARMSSDSNWRQLRHCRDRRPACGHSHRAGRARARTHRGHDQRGSNRECAAGCHRSQLNSRLCRRVQDCSGEVECPNWLTDSISNGQIRAVDLSLNPTLNWSVSINERRKKQQEPRVKFSFRVTVIMCDVRLLAISLMHLVRE